MILLVILLVIGNKNDPYKETEDAGKTAVEKDSDTSSQSNSSSTSTEAKTDGWMQINNFDFTISDRVEGTFTITNIEYFARTTGSDYTKLELRAVVTGAIDGLQGVYSMEIPWVASEQRIVGDNYLRIGNKISIYYYICSSDSGKFIMDLTHKK